MLKLGTLLLRFISLILGIEENQSFPPPLSKDEEAELFKRKAEGDERARDKLIEHNLRLVSHIIRKYYSSYEFPDELLSVGSLGLIKAVDSFKPTFGTRFATYGAKCVQNEILMFFRSKKKRGQEISINDQIDIDKDGNPLTYLDIISVNESIENDLDLKVHIEKIRALVDTVLLPREKEIIILRYGLKGYQPRTQRDVAKHLGISRSYVSRIEKKALEKLKDAFGDVIPCFDE
ncbi:MAG: RNA polymerase sporulation sigma factor SigK [Clostridia bacterium]|nr:RNA polymerase sporulation sigma factor SigK [Clostridia bacterium]